MAPSANGDGALGELGEEHLELVAVVVQRDDAGFLVVLDGLHLLLEPDPVSIGEVHPELLVQGPDEHG